VDLRDFEVVLLKLVDELSGVQLAVASASFDDLGLLFQGEVLPGEGGSDVLLEKSQDFIMGNGTRIGEVVDAFLVVLCEKDGGGEEIMKNRV